MLISSSQRAEYIALFGQNMLRIERPSVPVLIIENVFSPYSIYQIVCIIVWALDEYGPYAALVGFLMCFYFYKSIKEELHSYEKLNALNFKLVEEQRPQGDRLLSNMLVPGDLVVLQPHTQITADLLLVSGQAVIGESSLTGEPQPIAKNPFAHQSDFFSAYNKHIAGNPLPPIAEFGVTSSNLILAGTDCLAANDAVALVIRVGFCTFKGEIIRNLVLSEEQNLKITKDILSFLAICVLISTIVGVSYMLYEISGQQASLFMAVIRGLELLLIAVPAILPLCLSAGVEIAMERLKKKNIWIFDSTKINVAGRVKMIAFDKTGTLTQSKLYFYEYVSV